MGEHFWGFTGISRINSDDPFRLGGRQGPTVHAGEDETDGSGTDHRYLQWGSEGSGQSNQGDRESSYKHEFELQAGEYAEDQGDTQSSEAKGELM